jgi:hypothetical protein
MLLEIKGTLPCYSDALRVIPRESNYGASKLVLLSMFGNRNAVRAAWAKLSKAASRSGYRESIDVSGTPVAKSNDDSYSTVFAPIGRGRLHCLIWHQQLGHNAPDTGVVYQAGPDASTRYFDKLAKRCPVPLRAGWAPALWTLGQEHNAIKLLEGHGREVWSIDTTRETWEPILRDALIAKELL